MSTRRHPRKKNIPKIRRILEGHTVKLQGHDTLGTVVGRTGEKSGTVLVKWEGRSKVLMHTSRFLERIV